MSGERGQRLETGRNLGGSMALCLKPLAAETTRSLNPPQAGPWTPENLLKLTFNQVDAHSST